MRVTDRSIFFAAGGFAVAAAVFSVALARALSFEPTSAADAVTPSTDRAPSEANPATADEPLEPGARPGTAAAEMPEHGRASPDRPEVDTGAARALTLEALALAVDNDPFQPDRRRPPEPYRMPGEDVEEPELPPPPPPPPFLLLGTAQIGDGGLAVMQFEESPPRVLAVGETLMGYRLDHVHGDAATLTGEGRSLTFTVAQASPRPEPAREERRSRNSRDRESAADRARQLREQVLERALERQLRSGENAALDELRRLLEQRGQGNREVQFENGRTIIRGRLNTDTMMVEMPRRPPGGREETR